MSRGSKIKPLEQNLEEQESLFEQMMRRMPSMLPSQAHCVEAAFSFHIQHVHATCPHQPTHRSRYEPVGYRTADPRQQQGPDQCSKLMTISSPDSAPGNNEQAVINLMMAPESRAGSAKY